MEVTLHNATWHFDGHPTNPGTQAEGLLLNVRMVNAAFEDAARPDIDPDAITETFIRALPAYVRTGVNAFTVGLQGGSVGYEGAVCTAFGPDGALREPYLGRVRRIISACDALGVAVIVSAFYQRQDQRLHDEPAVERAVRNTAEWLSSLPQSNTLFEVANEFGHTGYTHDCLRDPDGVAALVSLAKSTAPDLLVSASRQSHRGLVPLVIETCDYAAVHYNQTPHDLMPAALQEAMSLGKPVVCNEDAKTGAAGARVLRLCVDAGVSWGYMNVAVNQHHPPMFGGTNDDPEVYAAFAGVTGAGR